MMTSRDTEDTEVGRCTRGEHGTITFYVSSRPSARGGRRVWLSVRYERHHRANARFFTIGLDELEALERAIAEVRRAAEKGAA